MWRAQRDAVGCRAQRRGSVLSCEFSTSNKGDAKTATGRRGRRRLFVARAGGECAHVAAPDAIVVLPDERLDRERGPSWNTCAVAGPARPADKRRNVLAPGLFR